MIDSSTTVDMIYLDFPKSFDKVDHGMVLHKLNINIVINFIIILVWRIMKDVTSIISRIGIIMNYI